MLATLQTHKVQSVDFSMLAERIFQYVATLCFSCASDQADNGVKGTKPFQERCLSRKFNFVAHLSLRCARAEEASHSQCYVVTVRGVHSLIHVFERKPITERLTGREAVRSVRQINKTM